MFNRLQNSNSFRTNLPKEVMDFPDMSYPQNLPSFMPHRHVREYYENCAKKWNLESFIKVYYVYMEAHSQYLL